VHRDLKGGNVLMTMDGTVKLADFGASKHFRDPNETDMMKSLKGSAFWMAPEVLESKYGELSSRSLGWEGCYMRRMTHVGGAGAAGRATWVIPVSSVGAVLIPPLI